MRNIQEAEKLWHTKITLVLSLKGLKAVAEKIDNGFFIMRAFAVLKLYVYF